MTHYGALVIFPEDADLTNVEAALTPIMAPFDENTQVDEYDRPCYCIGGVALRAARARADATVGTFDALRASFGIAWGADNPRPDWSTASDAEIAAHAKREQAAWSAHIAPYEAATEAFLASRADRESPNPSCDECHGTGTYRSTYNPKSKWDYWYLYDRERHDWNPTTIEDYDHRSPFPLTALSPKWSAYAIVTPDGEWHSKGRMGWWAISTGEDSEWDKLKYEIVSAFPGHRAIFVGMHI